MEKKLSKILIVVAVIMLWNILPIKTLAASSDVMVIKENNKYLIYTDKVVNENSEFAFSNSKEEGNLHYTKVEQDGNGNCIAYVDDDFKNNFFQVEDTYLWLKTNENIVINGEKITLDDAKTLEELNNMKDLTKNITVQSSAEEEKIKINGMQGEIYYYQFKQASSSANYSRLLNLVNEISKYDENTSMFVKLQSYSDLYEQYQILIDDLNHGNWIETNNLEITKPYGAKEDQQYILCLKDSNGNVDIQVLTAYEKTIVETTESKKVEEVSNTLPVTYDDTVILWIAFGISVVAIISILLFKKISQKSRRD